MFQSLSNDKMNNQLHFYALANNKQTQCFSESTMHINNIANKRHYSARYKTEAGFPFPIEDCESFAQFQAKFGTEEACAEALFKIKWPNGYECPRCACTSMCKITTRRLPLFECSDCSYQASLLTGTVMQGSRTNLRKWFLAFFLISRENSDLTAVRLQKEIQVTYKTAWLMLTKIRTAIHHFEAKAKLKNNIRINHVWHNIRKYSSAYHQSNVQPLLIGAQLDQAGQPIYIKFKKLLKKHIRGISANSLGIKKFITENICPENSRQIQNIECVTKPFSRLRCPILKQISHSASNWINTTFQGVSQKHLQKYLDEYTCRWNLVKAGSSIFKSLVMLCCTTPAVTYEDIIKNPV